MIKQHYFEWNGTNGFIDKYSDMCVDGKPCDTAGDVIYTIDGRRCRERDFKEYRKFSPQFRNRLIMENARKNGQSITEASCSCSKCGTVAADEVFCGNH